MYVYMLAMIYTYTYILNVICISKTEKQSIRKGGGNFRHARGEASKSIRSIS